MSELRKRGVVAAVICSTPFARLGETQARTFGAPDLDLVQIPHPLGGLELPDVRARAALTLPQIVGLIKKRLK